MLTTRVGPIPRFSLKPSSGLHYWLHNSAVGRFKHKYAKRIGYWINPSKCDHIPLSMCTSCKCGI